MKCWYIIKLQQAIKENKFLHDMNYDPFCECVLSILHLQELL